MAEREYELAIKGDWSHTDSEYQHTYIIAGTLEEAVSKSSDEIKETAGATGEFILSIEGKTVATGEYLGALKPESEGGDFNGTFRI